jgi:hypothetical protein
LQQGQLRSLLPVVLFIATGWCLSLVGFNDYRVRQDAGESLFLGNWILDRKICAVPRLLSFHTSVGVIMTLHGSNNPDDKLQRYYCCSDKVRLCIDN